ncbi:MAG: ankyrin repeat domain-containing protein [Acidobacteriaceae bacterium]
MSQRFLNLIRTGQTAEVAAAAEEDPSLIACRDAQGVSAFLWSIYSGQPVIRDFLLAHLDTLDIFEACALGECGRIESLLRQDAMLVHESSADGWGPLHLAAAFGGPQATALMLTHGAHVHRFSRNPMHNQALHACMALSQDGETVRLLIEQGADVNMAQAGGYTPLHQAAANGRADLVRILLEAGANPDMRCHQDKSPADYARERKHDEVVQLLSFTRTLS